MTASTVKVKLEQTILRGTKVVINESVGPSKVKLHGKTMVVASKQPVPCKGGRRCAGNWCVGLAAFVTDPRNFKKDKKLAWRQGAHKICLTHLTGEDGELILPPTAVEVAQEALTEPQVVTWEDLANAAADQDFHTMIGLARTLKRENELLLRKVIALQETKIEQLQE